MARLHSAVPLALTAWNRIGLGIVQMNLAAAEVIWRRSVMMAQGGLPLSEATKMVLEKSSTFATAAERAMVAAARGSNPAAVTAAALHPYRRRTTANARRLRR